MPISDWRQHHRTSCTYQMRVTACWSNSKRSGSSMRCPVIGRWTSRVVCAFLKRSKAPSIGLFKPRAVADVGSRRLFRSCRHLQPLWVEASFFRSRFGHRSACFSLQWRRLELSSMHTLIKDRWSGPDWAHSIVSHLSVDLEDSDAMGTLK